MIYRKAKNLEVSFQRITAIAAFLIMAAAAQEVDAQPANDNFTNRITLSGANISIAASNVGATRETGEPVHEGISGNKSVWWTWTAPSPGYVTITLGGNFTHVLAVYTGASLTSLTLVNGGLNSSGYDATAQFEVVAGNAVPNCRGRPERRQWQHHSGSGAAKSAQRQLRGSNRACRHECVNQWFKCRRLEGAG